MWLEGAVQSKWSVSAMRKERWETLGKVGEKPADGEIVSTELNEETQSLSLSEKPRNNDRDYVEGPVHEGPDWGDDASRQVRAVRAAMVVTTRPIQMTAMNQPLLSLTQSNRSRHSLVCLTM